MREGLFIRRARLGSVADAGLDFTKHRPRLARGFAARAMACRRRRGGSRQIILRLRCCAFLESAAARASAGALAQAIERGLRLEPRGVG